MDAARGIILPLLAGSPLQSHRRRNGYQDGTTATFVMMILQFSLIFVFVVMLADSKEVYFSEGVVPAFVGSFVSLGLLCCILVIIFTRVKGLNNITRPRKFLKVEIVFLLLFGIPSVLYCILKALNLINCKYYDGFSLRLFNANIFYYVVTSLFMLLEMFIISYFSRFKFLITVFTNYTLLFFVSGNLSIWFHSLIMDKNISHRNFSNSTSTFNVTHFDDCVWNSRLANLIGTLRPFLSPVLLEYSLLCISVGTDIFSPFANKEERHSDSISLETDPDDTEDDFSKELMNSLDSREGYSTFGREDRNQNDKDTSNKFRLMIVVILITEAVSLFGYLVFIIFLPDRIALLRIVRYSRSFLKLVMLSSNWFAFVYIEKETMTHRRFELFQHGEYTFVFTAFAKSVTHVIGLLSGVSSEETFKIVRGVLSLCQDYLQITFILHANRTTFRKNSPQKHVLKWICWILVVLNFGSWITDSFILHQFPETRVSKSTLRQRLHEYKIVSDILSPMAVYYRFISVFAFYAIIQKLQAV